MALTASDKAKTIGVLFGGWVLAASAGLLNEEGLDSGAANAVRNIGLTPTYVGGYSVLGCGSLITQWTDVATYFEATAPDGRLVTGTVCEGWFFKDKDVRFD